MNAQTLLWPAIVEVPALTPMSVHVHAWDLDTPPPHKLDWEVLSEEETLRAQRFVFPRDRDRYVRAHSVMRRFLGHYSGMLPTQVSFSSNAYGKPQIENSPSKERIQFNLTHSAGIAVLAVAASYELGVDLEIVRPIDAEIAEHHFSSKELHTLRGLSSGEWLQGFFRCWTSKEALLKGEGLGLNLPLNGFDVEADPRRSPALLASRPSAKIASGWRLVDLKPTHHTVGTLAVLDRTDKFSANNVRCFSLLA